MSDEQQSSTPEPQITARPSRRRLFLTMAIVVVVVAATWTITGAILRAVNAPASSALPAATAVPYTSADLGFSAKFPNTPTASSADQAVNGVTVTVNTVQWIAGPAGAAITVTDLADIIAGRDVDTVLDGSIEGMATGTGGTLSDKQFTTLDGVRAISGTITGGGAELRAVVAVADGTQFILVSTGQSAAEATAFFDSFTFLP